MPNFIQYRLCHLVGLVNKVLSIHSYTHIYTNIRYYNIRKMIVVMVFLSYCQNVTIEGTVFSYLLFPFLQVFIYSAILHLLNIVVVFTVKNLILFIFNNWITLANSFFFKYSKVWQIKRCKIFCALFNICLVLIFTILARNNTIETVNCLGFLRIWTRKLSISIWIDSRGELKIFTVPCFYNCSIWWERF